MCYILGEKEIFRMNPFVNDFSFVMHLHIKFSILMDEILKINGSGMRRFLLSNDV